MNQLISKKQVTDYFETLGKLPQATQVTGKSGQKLLLDAAIDQVIKLALSTHEKGGKLIFIGNGGSSAIASHMAIDYWKNGGIRSTSFSDPALLTCLSNDYGYEHVYERPIEMLAQPSDLLMAISSSGKSMNILHAVKAARQKKMPVVTFSGFQPDNLLRQTGDVNFYVASPEYGFVEITHLSICHSILDLASVACQRGSSL